jgi:hypothetical protein
VRTRLDIQVHFPELSELPGLPGEADQERPYDARVEDAGELTFQARTDPKLMAAMLRRALLPIVTPVGAAMLIVAVLLYQAGDPGGWALPILGGSLIGPLFILFTVPQQIVTREAHKIGRPVAYRIDAAGVRITAGFSTDTLTWSTIKAVRQAHGQILLSHRRLSGGKRRITGIPTADLTAAEQARLLTVLRSRGAALTNMSAS